MPCCKCDEIAVVHYCVDCDDVFCVACSDRIHQCNDADHSIELVMDEASRGVHIITPLVDELFLILAFVYGSRLVSFNDDYFAGSSYCPFLEEVRAGLARVDAGAVAVQRSSFQEYCGVEDSFWRFFGDTWLRSIVVGNDNIVLLLSSALPVFCMDIAVIWIMIPCVSCVYALFFWFVHSVESMLPRMQSIRLLEIASNSINAIDFVDAGPPETLPRFRASSCLLDGFTYRCCRFVRVPRYYFERISSKLDTLVHVSLGICLVIRVTCIFFGISALLPVFAAAVFLIVLRGMNHHGRHWIRPQSIGFFVPLLVIAGLQARSAFQMHSAMFRNVGQIFQPSELLFWHVSQGLINLSKDGATKLLQALFITVLTLLAFSSLLVLKNRCRKD